MPAARYWRVLFRDSSNYSNYGINIKSLRLRDANSTTLTGYTMAGTYLYSGALTALDDGNDSTVAVFSRYPTAYSGDWHGVTFTFTDPVLPDHLEINVSSTNPVGFTTVIPASSLDLTIELSTNGTNWVYAATYPRAMASADTSYRLAIDPASIYWFYPSRSQNAGAGGIYGIVSEDGVALPNRPVYLMDRGFGKLGYTVTDENGGYAFNGLNEFYEYIVASTDPSGPPYKNALIWDRVKPINTMSALAPTSPFWARRLRDSKFGFCATAYEYIDGTTYNYVLFPSCGGVMGFAPDYYGFDTAGVAGGNLKYLKSQRIASPTWLYYGAIWGPLGLSFDPAGGAANYAALSFEYIFIAPVGSEAQLVIGAIPSSSSDTSNSYPTYLEPQYGPTLQVTTTAANFRMALGGQNMSTIRATTPVTGGQAYHIVVTYTMDGVIKMYKDGVLVATTNIPGSGRMYTYSPFYEPGTGRDYTVSWDTAGGMAATAATRIVGAMVYGNGDWQGWGPPPAPGGRFGAMTFFGRELTQADVTALYDSVANPSSHLVPSSFSGYAGEVEADNPIFYFRLNELVQPPSQRIQSALGSKGIQMITHNNTGWGSQTAFTAGSTSISNSHNIVSAMTGVMGYSGTGNNNTDLRGRLPLNHIFSAEVFLRPYTSLIANNHVFVARIYNSSQAPAYATLSTGGILSLSVQDVTGLTTTFTFAHTALVLNQPYHIVFTYDPWTNKRARLYINGVMAPEQSATILPPLSASTWIGIGNNPTGSAPTYSNVSNLYLGEFAWYNHELTPERVAAHYAARNN